MNKKFAIIFILLMLLTNNLIFAAGTIDYSIPAPTNVTLASDGTVTWVANTTSSVKYNKFRIRLLKRSATTDESSSTTTYTYSDYGSIKSCDGDERSYDMNIGSAGVYRVKVQAVNADGNYSTWTESTVDVAVSSDETSGGISTKGGYNWSTGGPYVNNNGNTNLFIGPDGSVSYSSNNYNNGYYSNANNQSGLNIYDKNSFNQAQVVSTPGNGYVNPNQYQGPNASSYTNNNYNSYSGSNKIPLTATNIEVGWHVNNSGKFYYQGNGNYIKNSWALIDDLYYRFDPYGYILVAEWFKDETNNCWYLLGTDGRMLVDWQFVSGKWYYLNPIRGTGYGILYTDAIVTINGKNYAFNSNGELIINSWYNGSYYGPDGARVS